MIINFTYIKLIIISAFVIILPFVQKQWFNLYIFNGNNFSFYFFLYYLSGIICPLFVTINSIKIFTNYKFHEKNPLIDRLISGKKLLTLVLFILTPLTFLIYTYFYINLNLLSNLFFKNIFLPKISFLNQSFFLLTTFVLLIFRQTRIFIKKLTSYNFLFIAIMIWHIQTQNILISDKNFINNFSYFDDFNYINVIFLFSIEVIYYLWSLVSYKNNLSDWISPIPLKVDYLSILKITSFYFIIIVYYSILN